VIWRGVFEDRTQAQCDHLLNLLGWWSGQTCVCVCVCVCCL